MKRIFGIVAGITLTGLAVVSVVALAQQTQPAPDRDVVFERARAVQGPEGPPPPPGDTFLFMASEVNFEGKPVKGSPYSAQAVTETTQTLGDGNRIVNKVTSLLYRDSDGRTRREQTIKGIGGFGEGGEPLQTVFINDPVAGVSYALDSRTHIAHKNTPFRFERGPLPGGVPGTTVSEPNSEKLKVKIEQRGVENGYVVTQTTPMPAAPPPGAPGPGPEGEQFTLKTEGGSAGGFVFFRKDKSPDKNVVKESLGKQFFDGVEAEGTRTTLTIPAGEIGNERAIEILSERWYSPELQMVVMSRHSDPRSGETTYRLTNISRDEPAKSLFEVPGGFTIKEGRGEMHTTVMPARIRKPSSPE